MSLSFPPEGYNLTENPQTLPQHLLRTECKDLFVEFLRVNTTAANPKNHIVFKIDFKSACGARLSPDLDYELGSTGSSDSQPGLKPGKMLLKHFCAYLVRVYPNLPLNHIISTPLYYKLHDFYFANIGERYYGYRDFILSQTTRKTPADSIYDALGMRFSGGGFSACPIDRGYFSDEYQRVEE
ncbi:hypothetical protein jhhlp_007569 [Lomentospora prolificans]|uniref:Uncharacterized protein n=1 Tax=Lomentospora prolificans TaxID=41688 RepID=A0A2N3MZZ8_9PEZI|nr:hypothetical protein jhhlp_007569 [Lomentospora prolificans]